MMMRGGNFMYLRRMTAVAVQITHGSDIELYSFHGEPTDYLIP